MEYLILLLPFTALFLVSIDFISVYCERKRNELRKR